MVRGPRSMVRARSECIAPKRVGLNWETRILRKPANEALIRSEWRTESVAPHPQSVWFCRSPVKSVPSVFVAVPNCWGLGARRALAAQKAQWAAASAELAEEEVGRDAQTPRIV